MNLTQRTTVSVLVAMVTAALAATLLAPAPADAAKKRKAAPTTYIYALCGPNVCRIDTRTRKSRIVLRRSSDKEYGSVAASPSGDTLAFVYDGDVFRSGRDGRGRKELDTSGTNPHSTIVSPDGATVAWFATLHTSQCLYNWFTGGLDCLPVSYTYLYRQGRGYPEADSAGSRWGSAGWLRGELLVQDDPDEGEADFICLIDAEDDCTRTLAQDPARAYSSPATSPDGRYLAVVSEPAPPENGDMDFQGRIEIFNAANGTRIRNLTSGTKDDTPIFSPDGKTVAFNRGKDLLTRSVKGGKPKLVKRDVELTGPSWARGRR
jgi:dipeptidyl aminopeptidase/acylaminoacyl peptidase